MTKEQYRAFRIQLRRKVNEAKRAGMKLVAWTPKLRTLRTEDGAACCPLGAMKGAVLWSPDKVRFPSVWDEVPMESDLGRYGVERSELGEFIDGFDCARVSGQSPFFKLGRKYRKEALDDAARQ